MKKNSVTYSLKEVAVRQKKDVFYREFGQAAQALGVYVNLNEVPALQHLFSSDFDGEIQKLSPLLLL